ncbi:ankyrin and het domain protein [Colletotrichum kahawae]|uniref:Ankyrin and het domain protein n=1 Tax=Colletotrichum kahawae TaxID=34407 RepID=A0AAE0D3R3_COLKA|nr:ankyrin and het domain protein [Colletotrichum kahawae]
MNLYQYRALKPGEIRLLRLHPAPDPRRDLTGTILHHELANPAFRWASDGPYLEHKLPYEAVSYHWGSNTKTPFKLLVRDEIADSSTPASIIPLTASLHTLLRQISYTDKDRLVWVDAICINQVLGPDNVEKGAQIRMMPDIYGIASRVLVYLGPPADDSDLAITFLEHISDFADYLDEVLPTANFPAALAAGFVMPSPDAPEWPALRAFWRRPWFRRVWVVQEFVNATELTVLCGAREIDWRRLWLATRAYVDNLRLAHQGYRSNWRIPLQLLVPWYRRRRLDQWRLAHEGASAMHTIGDFRLRRAGYMSPAYMWFNYRENTENDRWREPLPVKRDFGAICEYERFARPKMLETRAEGRVFPFGRRGLLELFMMTGSFLATQPVDRIYALLGLAEDVDGEEFAPIYSKEQSLAAVSKRFAIGKIEQGQGAEVLARSGLRFNKASKRAGEVPSWVPDWTSVTYAQDKRPGFTLRSHGKRNEEAEWLKNKNQEPGDDGTTLGPQTEGGNDEPLEDSMRLYTACGDTNFYHHFDETRNILYVKSIGVDSIAAIIPGRLRLGAFMNEFLIMAMFNITGREYPTGEKLEDVIWRTQIANRTSQGEVAGPEVFALYELVKKRDRDMFKFVVFTMAVACVLASPFALAILRRLPLYLEIFISAAAFLKGKLPLKYARLAVVCIFLLRWLHWLFTTPLLLYSIYVGVTNIWQKEFLVAVSKFGVTSASDVGSLPPECAMYTNQLSNIANKYELAVTKQGLIGLVPLCMEVGDRVGVIHGCDAPFVLRLDEQKRLLRVIGESYIHGIMNGELAGAVSEEVGLY